MDFTGSRWKTVDYLTGLMGLINTESSILRARCRTESQSSGTEFTRPEMSVCHAASRIQKNGMRHDL